MVETQDEVMPGDSNGPGNGQEHAWRRYRANLIIMRGVNNQREESIPHTLSTFHLSMFLHTLSHLTRWMQYTLLHIYMHRATTQNV